MIDELTHKNLKTSNSSSTACVPVQCLVWVSPMHWVRKSSMTNAELWWPPIYNGYPVTPTTLLKIKKLKQHLFKKKIWKICLWRLQSYDKHPAITTTQLRQSAYWKKIRINDNLWGYTYALSVEIVHSLSLTFQHYTSLPQEFCYWQQRRTVEFHLCPLCENLSFIIANITTP